MVLTTGNGQNLLSWVQVIGATGYTVQRSTTGVSGSFTTVSSSVAVPFYLDITCLVGVQYWYQVASNNVSGTSSFANLGTNGLALSIVPCLPGQISLSYLRYFSKLKADKLNSEFVTDDEWNFNINQSSTKLYDLLVTKFGDKYFFAPPLVIPGNGTNVVAVPNGSNYPTLGVYPPACYKLAGVDASSGAAGSNSSNAWFTLPTFNWIDRNKFNTLQLAGSVTSISGLAYCWQGQNIYFQPYPTNAQSLRLWYVPMLIQMLLDTDMMPFSISGWSELVIVDAAIKALVKEESYDQAKALVGERGELIQRIEETAANRDVGQPNVVSNTRANAGDPNFGMMGGFGSSGFGGGFGWGG